VKKQYAIKQKDGKLVSITVDGTEYDSVDAIPDPDDRAQVELLLADNLDAEFGNFDKQLDKQSDKQFDEQFARTSTGAPPFTKMIAGIFAAVAILMFAIAGISAFMVVRTLDSEAHAPGRVVDLAERYDRAGNTFYYPVVTFSLPDERQLEVQLADGAWPAAYAIGDPVQIAYDPAQPRNARIDSPSNTFAFWIVPIITGVLGIAFAGATALALWIGK
jgi:hypothetical protein